MLLAFVISRSGVTSLINFYAKDHLLLLDLTPPCSSDTAKFLVQIVKSWSTEIQDENRESYDISTSPVSSLLFPKLPSPSFWFWFWYRNNSIYSIIIVSLSPQLFQLYYTVSETGKMGRHETQTHQLQMYYGFIYWGLTENMSRIIRKWMTIHSFEQHQALRCCLILGDTYQNI